MQSSDILPVKRNRAFTPMQLTEEVLVILVHFDKLKYPVTSRELHLLLKTQCRLGDVEEALDKLLDRCAIHHRGNLYTLSDMPDMVAWRKSLDNKALSSLKSAESLSAILIRVPFVRGIAMAGKLSKSTAQDTPVNFLITTSKNRLGLVKHLVRLTFALTNTRQNYSAYFIDEANLALADTTLANAIEVTSLKPLHGDVAMEEFYNTNRWLRAYFPNKTMWLSSAQPHVKRPLKAFLERVINILGAGMINKLLKV